MCNFRTLFRGLFRAPPKINDGAFFVRIVNGLKSLSNFGKKNPSQVVNSVLNALLLL